MEICILRVLQNVVGNFVIPLQLGHLLFIFAVLVPKDSDCDHKMRISFYDKIEILKVVFVTPQHRLRSFSIFHEKRKRLVVWDMRFKFICLF